MRPPILEWKVMLALFAVVIVGASVGRVLHSPTTGASFTDKLVAVSTITRSAPPSAVTPLVPAPMNQCKAFKKALRSARPADRPVLRTLMKSVCHKRH